MLRVPSNMGVNKNPCELSVLRGQSISQVRNGSSFLHEEQE